jgi:NADH-quinone oxidoreductase subunit F
VVPGTDKVLDTPLTYEAMGEIGTVLGSASVIVMDESTDMVWAALKMAKFFKHESCGKCTPCREGTFWLTKTLNRVMYGEGTLADIDLLHNVAKQMTGVTLCALGDFAANPVLSTIKHFRGEYEAYIKKNASIPKAAPKAAAVAGD